MSKKIMLDSGHGLNTSGKRSPNGDREFTLNHKVCLYIKERLSAYECEVAFSHDPTGAVDVSLADRVKASNNYKPDVFVSIHHNALNGVWGTHGGVEVYAHSQGTNEDRKLASLIAPTLAKETGLKNRGAKAEAFAVLTVNATAVLCEGGFMDSSVDYPVIVTEKGQRAYAKAVADSLISYLGLKAKPVVAPTLKCPTCGQIISGYTVQKGDTLWGIATTNGTTVDALKKLNGLSNDNLSVGQVLKLK